MFRRQRDVQVDSGSGDPSDLTWLSVSMEEIKSTLQSLTARLDESNAVQQRSLESFRDEVAAGRDWTHADPLAKKSGEGSRIAPGGQGPSFRTRIIRPMPISAPAESSLRRQAPRDTDAQQDDYLESFDDETLFYDIFRREDELFLSGPPLLNVMSVLQKGKFLTDGNDVTDLVSLVDRGRTQRSSIRTSLPSQFFTIKEESNHFDQSVPVGLDGASMFKGRRTLVTLSKNNDLVWIRDWLVYYHRVHGVDAVLFYDNASSAYTPEDLQQMIDSVPGIEAGVVVPWRFKYGPGGGPKQVWDSDFCQYSVLEHAHWRFLRHAAGVINADIDELVVTDDGRSAFEHAADSESGVALYAGRWIEMATDSKLSADRTRRFSDYRYHADSNCTTKWTLIPERLPENAQWRVHSINDLKLPRSPGIMHRHFKGINTNWKYNRQESLVGPEHKFDADLVTSLNQAFGPN